MADEIPISTPTITSPTTASGKVGSVFGYTIVGTNSPMSYSATGLPSGMSVNTSSGIISGTPTAPAITPVTIGAANGGGTGTETLTISIAPALPNTCVVSAALLLPGNLPAANRKIMFYVDVPATKVGGNLAGSGAAIATTNQDGVFSCNLIQGLAYRAKCPDLFDGEKKFTTSGASMDLTNVLGI